MSRLLLQRCTGPGSRAAWRALLALLVLVITWLALSPAPPKALNTGWDKANHTLAFAALAFSAVWGFWRHPRQWIWLVLALVGYGIAIEIAQSFLPPREADWHDVVADSAGIAVGLLVARAVAAIGNRAT